MWQRRYRRHQSAEHLHSIRQLVEGHRLALMLDGLCARAVPELGWQCGCAQCWIDLRWPERLHNKVLLEGSVDHRVDLVVHVVVALHRHPVTGRWRIEGA